MLHKPWHDRYAAGHHKYTVYVLGAKSIDRIEYDNPIKSNVIHRGEIVEFASNHARR